MKVRGKGKNHRLERKKVLEVKMRSRQLRAARLRLLCSALTVSFVALVVLFFLWRGGEWGLDKLVFSNKRFTLAHIEVRTDGVITEEQLRQWAKVKVGENLLALDLSRIKRDLELTPWIETAGVERVLPDRLKIEVAERRPIARVHTLQPRVDRSGLTQVTFYLDAHGSVLLPLAHRQRSRPPTAGERDLPIFFGVPQPQLRPGNRIEAAPVQAGLRLLRVFEHSSMVGLVELEYVDVSSPQIMKVTTSQGSRITMAPDNLEWQLRRWRQVHELGLRADRIIATLDLSISNNVPAQWRAAEPGVSRSFRVPSPPPTQFKERTNV